MTIFCLVALCILAKRYVLAKNCLKEQIGNQGQRVDFWPTVLSVEPMVQYVVCRRLSVVVCDVLYCGKTVRPSQKVSEGVNRKPGSKSSFFGSPPHFYFRFCRYGHRDGRFWPTVLSVEPLVHCVVCLSSVCLSVTFCIVAKRYVLAKNCLKKWIGNQGQKVDFFGRRHISTSGFGSTATETAVFALFLPVQPSDWY